jgi:hypothetical protein
MVFGFSGLATIIRADFFMQSILTLMNSIKQENRRLAEICIRILLVPVLVIAMFKLTGSLCELLAIAVVRF